MRRFRLCIRKNTHQGQEPFFSCVFDSPNSDSYSKDAVKGWRLFRRRYAIKGAYGHSKARSKSEAFGHPLSDLLKEKPASYTGRKRQGISAWEGARLLAGEAAGFITPAPTRASAARWTAHIYERVFNADSQLLKSYRKASLRLRVRYL